MSTETIRIKRPILEIDEQLCDGCGLCIPACAEGALQIVEGKARLVGELLCDGLGACLGECPQDALKVIEREAAPFDEEAVAEQLAKLDRSGVQPGPGPQAGPPAQAEAKPEPEACALPPSLGGVMGRAVAPEWKAPSAARPAGRAQGNGGGCPGSAPRRMAAPSVDQTRPADSVPSTLRSWPVQLRLMNPAHPALEGADLLLAADCVPFAFGNFHSELLAGRVPLVACPKLDDSVEQYVATLSSILAQRQPRSLTVARMEVPCCGGILRWVGEALQRSGARLPVRVVTISATGECLEERELRPA